MMALRSLAVGVGIVAIFVAGTACDESSAPDSGRPESVADASVSIEKGRTLYNEYGCVACHGPKGAGNGPLARSLPVTPRNLSSPASYRNGSDVGSVTKTIAEGLMTKGSGMPPYPHIPESERRGIATFLVSLQKP